MTETRQPGAPDETAQGSPSHPPIGQGHRERLLAGLPVTERRLDPAGVSTAVLEGGAGPPLVLLHGPGEHAAKWLRLLPLLTPDHHAVAPDLPGHGASAAMDEPLDADRVVAWLGELVERTCPTPPVLVGQILGGAIAARFAAAHGERLRHLVLTDSLGLAPFQPAPEFGGALGEFVTRPTPETHERLWRLCAHDLEALRSALGPLWEPFEAYNLDRARDASGGPTRSALMELFGLPALPDDVLAAIRVPTTLIWGRHDLATPLSVAEAASGRYGWPLQVIDGAADDPPLEQPEAFAAALRTAVGPSGSRA